MRQILRKASALLGCLVPIGPVLLQAGSAQAHIDLRFPTARHSQRYVNEKDAPCGQAGADPRGTQVSTFEPGTTITVRWDEYIGHPGHFRLWFDDDGQDAFTYPGQPGTAGHLISGNPLVMDNLSPEATGTVGSYQVAFTLPNIECSRCTLQLVQVMTDKQGNGWGNDDLYFDCADLVLQRGAVNTADPGPNVAEGMDAGVSPGPSDAAMHVHEDAPSKKSDGGCSLARGTPPMPWWLAGLAVGRGRRRRLRQSQNHPPSTGTGRRSEGRPKLTG